MGKIPAMERVEAQAFKRQQTAFCVLTLFVIAILLLMHALFAPLLGEPSKAVILILAFSFGVKVWETLWLQNRQEGISAHEARVETAVSAVGIFILAAVLAYLTNRDDTPYFVLLAIPILQCAYHCGLFATSSTVVGAIAMMFAWDWHYFRIHPPTRPTEYLQTGMIAVIFCLTGPLVWFLVNQLNERERSLYEKMIELESAREKLVAEEKLSAIGRFASGIAHEIRNPVAMIASSLATAAYPAADARERDEMFTIAAREARRLENLTTDFLIYARPSPPQRSLTSLGDITRHIADVTRIRAAGKSIEVACRTDDEIYAEIDPSQMEGALLNLSLNALEATPAGGRIELRTRSDGAMACIDVENSGPAIPEPYLPRVFEPFFTTKPGGTGLGLAIARGIAVAHAGDLRVSANGEGAVVFTLSLPTGLPQDSREEILHGKSSGN